PRNALVRIILSIYGHITDRTIVWVDGAVESECSEYAIAMIRSNRVDASSEVLTDNLSCRCCVRAFINVIHTVFSLVSFTAFTRVGRESILTLGL
ncbi:hypothetical protein PENTCL1PPCAC_17243, partial [Pristionchus entomophagus]